jgi:hypothetical protein
VPSRSVATPPTPGSIAWRLVQATELLRLCEDRVDLALRLLAGVDSDLSEDGRVTLAGEVLAELSQLTTSAWQIAERVAQLTAGLPEQDGIDATYPQLADAAAQDLAQGMLDIDRVRWAAALLNRDLGWPALGSGLLNVDVRSAWGPTKLETILGAFRGAGQTRTRDAIGAAKLPFDADFASCSLPAIARLASALGCDDDDDPAQ